MKTTSLKYLSRQLKSPWPSIRLARIFAFRTFNICWSRKFVLKQQINMFSTFPSTFAGNSVNIQHQHLQLSESTSVHVLKPTPLFMICKLPNHWRQERNVWHTHSVFAGLSHLPTLNNSSVRHPRAIVKTFHSVYILKNVEIFEWSGWKFIDLRADTRSLEGGVYVCSDLDLWPSSGQQRHLLTSTRVLSRSAEETQCAVIFKKLA